MQNRNLGILYNKLNLSLYKQLNKRWENVGTIDRKDIVTDIFQRIPYASQEFFLTKPKKKNFWELRKKNFNFLSFNLINIEKIREGFLDILDKINENELSKLKKTYVEDEKENQRLKKKINKLTQKIGHCTSQLSASNLRIREKANQLLKEMKTEETRLNKEQKQTIFRQIKTIESQKKNIRRLKIPKKNFDFTFTQNEKLKIEIKDQKTQIEVQTSQIVDQKRKIASKQQTIDSQKNTIDVLNEENGKFDQFKTKYTQQMIQMNDELTKHKKFEKKCKTTESQMNKTQTILQNKNLALTQKLDEAKKFINELETTVKLLEKKQKLSFVQNPVEVKKMTNKILTSLSKRENELFENEQQFVEMFGKASLALKENKQLKAQLSENERYLEQLKVKLKDEKREREILQQHTTQWKTDFEKKKENDKNQIYEFFENSLVESERENKEKFNSLKQKLDETEKRVEGCFADMENCSTNMKFCSEKNNENSEEIKSLKKTISRLKSENNDCQSENKSFLIEINNVNQKLDNLNDENEKCKEENKELDEKNQDCRDEIKDVQSILQNYKTQTQNLIDEQNKEISKKKKKIIGLEEGLKEKEGAFKEIEIDLTELEEKYDNLSKTTEMDAKELRDRKNSVLAQIPDLHGDVSTQFLDEMPIGHVGLIYTPNLREWIANVHVYADLEGEKAYALQYMNPEYDKTHRMMVYAKLYAKELFEYFVKL